MNSLGVGKSAVDAATLAYDVVRRYAPFPHRATNFPKGEVTKRGSELFDDVDTGVTARQADDFGNDPTLVVSRTWTVVKVESVWSSLLPTRLVPVDVQPEDIE